MEGMGIVLWVIIAVVVAAVAEVAFDRRTPVYNVRRLFTLVAALLGGLAMGTWYGEGSTWGPNVEGFNAIPGLLGTVVLVVLRELTGEKAAGEVS